MTKICQGIKYIKWHEVKGKLSQKCRFFMKIYLEERDNISNSRNLSNSQTPPHLTAQ